MRRILLIIPLVTLGFVLNARVIHIPNDQATIQAGIDASFHGDTIIVSEGTYYENIIFRGKAITLASQYLLDRDTTHIWNTVIDGSKPVHPDTASTVRFTSGEDSTSILCGFRITGGRGTNTWIDQPNCRVGGGICILQSGGKIIKNIIIGNRIEERRKVIYGGGLYASTLKSGCNLIIADNIIIWNRLHTGYAVDGAGISVVTGKEGRVWIRNNKIANNAARSTGTYYAHGGGLSLVTILPSEGQVMVSGNNISSNKIFGINRPRPTSLRGYDNRHLEYGNQIKLYGAGIYILIFRESGNYIDLNSSPVLYDNTISENFSDKAGGGVAIIMTRESLPRSVISPRPVFMNNTITGNRSKNGAGMIIKYAHPLLINNVLNNDLSAGDCEEILDLEGSEVFTIDNEIRDTWTGNEVHKFFGKFYLRTEYNFFKMDRRIRNGSIKAVHIPPPWRSWWAFTIYGLIFIGIFALYRRYLLKRAELKTALRIERIEKEKVREIDQVKSRFYSNITHEFRTPLTLILGPLENFDTRKTENFSLTRDLVITMRRNARRLQRLINQLLDISKLETGKISMQVSEGDLTGFVRAIVLSFLSLAESKNIKYVYDLPETSREVYFDSDKVEKILTNLISNAFKFTPAGGEVSVRLDYIHSGNPAEDQKEGSGPPCYMELIVRDTGQGIPQENVSMIFDRFYQVSDSDTREQEGTGIGLALTKELVELYRGRIGVESETGRGSSFTVILPVIKEQFRESEIVEVPVGEPTNLGTDEMDEIGEGLQDSVEFEKQRGQDERNKESIILIVEDNSDLRTYISQNLNTTYRILEAENGRIGMEKTIETIPDLVISDLMMPVMDGIEMCKHLKTDERTSHIPIILLTARADRDSKIKGLENEADDYIIKPFDAEELRVRVKNLIRQRKKLIERYQREFLTAPTNLSIDPAEEKFMTRVQKCIETNLADFEFSVEKLGEELHMSRIQLYRKLIALTGYAPVELIRNTRLKLAAKMFQAGHKNISRVMYEVGISSPSHFAQKFRDMFGVNPSDYVKNTTKPEIQ